jgi:methionyl-tRNA formyltransferase
MKVAFIGVVRTAKSALEALKECGADVSVFTADIDQLLKTSGMDRSYYCELDGLKEWTAEDIKKVNPELIFCVGWSKILPQEILDICPCIGIHDSYLPDRRGGAPLNWALIDGLDKIGITMFYMNDGIDSGDIIEQRMIRIHTTDDANTLLDKIAFSSGLMVDHYFNMVKYGIITRTPQDHSKATYTRRRKPEDGEINWKNTTLQIHNFVRALTKPFPGAYCLLGKQNLVAYKMIVWETRLSGINPAAIKLKVGELRRIGDMFIAGTGDGVIDILKWEYV